MKFEDIINEHAASVADFYQWFVVRQSELQVEAFEELRGLENKRGDLQQKIENLEDILESTEKTAITIREERESLIRELEEERQHREQEKLRADQLEVTLEDERNKGFWGRLFGG